MGMACEEQGCPKKGGGCPNKGDCPMQAAEEGMVMPERMRQALAKHQVCIVDQGLPPSRKVCRKEECHRG